MTRRYYPSRTTMRRHVAAAGGYYSRQSGQWVIPGAMHNCTPWSTETQWLPTLEEAYDAAGAAAAANREVEEFGRREHAYLALNRY